MLALKLIQYFSNHLATFGFWSSSAPDNITLNPAIRRLMRVFQTFRLALVLLLMPCLIQSSLFLIPELHLLIPLPFQGSDGGVIPVQEELEVLTKVYDMLDNTVSMWVGNVMHILASLCNSASRQHYEVRASHYPFFHNFKDSVPPSEACLYCCIR